MNVLILNHDDTGGQSIRTVQAFRKHQPAWSVRSVGDRQTYLRYPLDLSLPGDREFVQRLYREADVIHCNGATVLALETFVEAPIEKPIVIHQHGTPFRDDPEKYLAVAHERRARVLAATIDLTLLGPGIQWCPTICDIPWMSSFRCPIEDGRIRIGHAPTKRGVKSTVHFLMAMRRLERELPVECVLIERRPWYECLNLKGRCDIFFDQAILGYGINAVECFAMGIPVLAGGAPATIAAMLRILGELPFYETTEDSIYPRLKELVLSTDLRREYAERGWRYVRRWHDERVVLRSLQGVYEGAASTGIPNARSPSE